MTKILMPKELTAENGAKYIFTGTFKEGEYYVSCPCYEGAAGADCEYCGGTGDIYCSTTVSWDTIKAIYKLAVEKLGQPIDENDLKSKFIENLALCYGNLFPYQKRIIETLSSGEHSVVTCNKRSANEDIKIYGENADVIIVDDPLEVEKLITSKMAPLKDADSLCIAPIEKPKRDKPHHRKKTKTYF